MIFRLPFHLRPTFVWGSVYDDICLHSARSYTSSPDSHFSLISCLTLFNNLLLGLPLLLLPCTPAPTTLLNSALFASHPRTTSTVHLCWSYHCPVLLPLDIHVHFSAAQHSRHFHSVLPPTLHSMGTSAFSSPSSAIVNPRYLNISTLFTYLPIMIELYNIENKCLNCKNIFGGVIYTGVSS